MNHEIGPTVADIADRVLAVLGLDDSDAAVNRLAGFMSTTEPYQHFHPENLKGHAGRALEAALTPPEGEKNG